jgi:hypothetical protein
VHLIILKIVLGLRSNEFPKELSAQNMKATAMVHEMIKKVLGREEPFTLSVRKGSGTIRYARDSNMLLIPPIEVTEIGYMVSSSKICN